ncbi:hypothetical protein [Streptomyces sp. NPDC047985]
MPESGGETVIHHRHWSPEDEERREGYGYAEAVAVRHPAVSVRPSAGDAILFDPHNYHLVRQNEGKGRRIIFSFFIAVTGRGHLTV